MWPGSCFSPVQMISARSYVGGSIRRSATKLVYMNLRQHLPYPITTDLHVPAQVYECSDGSCSTWPVGLSQTYGPVHHWQKSLRNCYQGRYIHKNLYVVLSTFLFAPPLSPFLPLSPKHGLTVMHYVCCTDHLEILQWLLTTKKGVCGTKEAVNAQSKVYPELKCSHKHNTHTALIGLTHLHVPTMLDLCPQKGYTPLLVACQYQKHSLVTELLSAGADPKTTTKVHCTLTVHTCTCQIPTERQN